MRRYSASSWSRRPPLMAAGSLEASSGQPQPTHRAGARGRWREQRHQRQRGEDGTMRAGEPCRTAHPGRGGVRIPDGHEHVPVSRPPWDGWRSSADREAKGGGPGPRPPRVRRDGTSGLAAREGVRGARGRRALGGAQLQAAAGQGGLVWQRERIRGRVHTGGTAGRVALPGHHAVAGRRRGIAGRGSQRGQPAEGARAPVVLTGRPLARAAVLGGLGAGDEARRARQHHRQQGRGHSARRQGGESPEHPSG